MRTAPSWRARRGCVYVPNVLIIVHSLLHNPFNSARNVESDGSIYKSGKGGSNIRNRTRTDAEVPPTRAFFAFSTYCTIERGGQAAKKDNPLEFRGMM